MNLYDVLGVAADAAPDEIKAAYRKAAQRYHPDREEGDREMFDAVQKAYETLSDPEARRVYDEVGDAGAADLTRRARDRAVELLSEFMDGMPARQVRNALEESITAFKDKFRSRVEEIEESMETLDEEIATLRGMEGAIPGEVFKASLERALEAKHLRYEAAQEARLIEQLCEGLFEAMVRGEDEPDFVAAANLADANTQPEE